MAYFARCVYYAGTDNESLVQGFYAVIELAHRKGGEIIKRFGYSYLTNPEKSLSRMIEAEPNEDPKDLLWSAPAGRWQNTTRWLYPAVRARDIYFADGQYREFGRWVKVGTPAPWKKRRNKKPLRFGELAHILTVKKVILKELERRLLALECVKRYDVLDEEEGGIVSEIDDDDPDIIACRGEIAGVNKEIEIVKAEMRYKTYRMFPVPTGKRPNRFKKSNTVAIPV